jgi:DNA modification methylase|nr:MAG TPA: adenine-specific methyltransferase [Caudoviricetes sp.]
MGSGSTAVAAINTGRNYIGFETNPQYYEIAMKRACLTAFGVPANLIKEAIKNENH